MYILTSVFHLLFENLTNEFIKLYLQDRAMNDLSIGIVIIHFNN